MFSNGSEYEAWSAAWCQTCEKDRGESCDIILRGFLHEATPEWGRGPHWSPQTVVYCTEYERIRPLAKPKAGPSEIPGQTTIHDHLIDETRR